MVLPNICNSHSTIYSCTSLFDLSQESSNLINIRTSSIFRDTYRDRHSSTLPINHHHLTIESNSTCSDLDSNDRYESPIHLISNEYSEPHLPCFHSSSDHSNQSDHSDSGESGSHNRNLQIDSLSYDADCRQLNDNQAHLNQVRLWHSHLCPKRDSTCVAEHIQVCIANQYRQPGSSWTVVTAECVSLLSFKCALLHILSRPGHSLFARHSKVIKFNKISIRSLLQRNKTCSSANSSSPNQSDYALFCLHSRQFVDERQSVHQLVQSLNKTIKRHSNTTEQATVQLQLVNQRQKSLLSKNQLVSAVSSPALNQPFSSSSSFTSSLSPSLSTSSSSSISSSSYFASNCSECKCTEREMASTLPTSSQTRKKRKRSKLIEAIHAGNADKVTKALGSCDANFVDESSGETPLSLCCSLGGDPKSDSNESNSSRLNPTQIQKLLVALVNGGAVLDFRRKDGRTPLHVAVLAGNGFATKTLLELGCSPDVLDADGKTPLFHTVVGRKNSAKLAQLLLQHHARPGCRDANGWAEVHHCAKLGLAEHLRLLLYYGADLNVKIAGSGNSALHVAAINDQQECTRLLLQRGADCTLRNNSHQTAHQVAVIAGNSTLAEMITAHKPEHVQPFTEKPKLNTTRKSATSAVCRDDSEVRYEGGNGYGTSITSSESKNGTKSDTNLDESKQTKTEGSRQSRSERTKQTANSVRPIIRYEEKTVQLRRVEGSGFGFILRGLKGDPTVFSGATLKRGTVLTTNDSKTDSNEDTQKPSTSKGIIAPTKPPSPQDCAPQPISSQYLDEVEKGGVADRAGLRAGDFVVNVDGVDVHSAGHDFVVHLIRRSGDQVTLTVATPIYQVDSSGNNSPSDHSSPSSIASFATDQVYDLNTRRKTQRSTSTHVGSKANTNGLIDANKSDNQSICSSQNGQSNGNEANNNGMYQTLGRNSKAPPPAPPRRDPTTTLSIGRARAKSLCVADKASGSIDSSKSNDREGNESSGHASFDQCNNDLLDQNGSRVASIRSRSCRRISAVELEQFFARQSNTPDQLEKVNANENKNNAMTNGQDASKQYNSNVSNSNEPIAPRNGKIVRQKQSLNGSDDDTFEAPNYPPPTPPLPPPPPDKADELNQRPNQSLGNTPPPPPESNHRSTSRTTTSSLMKPTSDLNQSDLNQKSTIKRISIEEQSNACVDQSNYSKQESESIVEDIETKLTLDDCNGNAAGKVKESVRQFERRSSVTLTEYGTGKKKFENLENLINGCLAMQAAQTTVPNATGTIPRIPNSKSCYEVDLCEVAEQRNKQMSIQQSNVNYQNNGNQNVNKASAAKQEDRKAIRVHVDSLGLAAVNEVDVLAELVPPPPEFAAATNGSEMCAAHASKHNGSREKQEQQQIRIIAPAQLATGNQSQQMQRPMQLSSLTTDTNCALLRKANLQAQANAAAAAAAAAQYGYRLPQQMSQSQFATLTRYVKQQQQQQQQQQLVNNRLLIQQQQQQLAQQQSNQQQHATSAAQHAQQQFATLARLSSSVDSNNSCQAHSGLTAAQQQQQQQQQLQQQNQTNNSSNYYYQQQYATLSRAAAANNANNAKVAAANNLYGDYTNRLTLNSNTVTNPRVLRQSSATSATTKPILTDSGNVVSNNSTNSSSAVTAAGTQQANTVSTGTVNTLTTQLTPQQYQQLLLQRQQQLQQQQQHLQLAQLKAQQQQLQVQQLQQLQHLQQAQQVQQAQQQAQQMHQAQQTQQSNQLKTQQQHLQQQLKAQQQQQQQIASKLAKKCIVDWTRTDVAEWVAAIGMSEHLTKFDSVDGVKLLQLDVLELQQMGVRQPTHRQFIMEKLKQHVHYQQTHPAI